VADKTSSAMVIDVPRSVIMAVIADFASYPAWASGVREATVLVVGDDGRPARVRFTIDAGLIKDSYVLSYAWHGDGRVEWTLDERGSMVSAMTGSYQLTGGADGSDRATRVTYELAVGLAVPMPGMVKRRAEKTIVDTALRGLRGRAEKVAAENGGDR
jgi:hypothetical protein